MGPPSFAVRGSDPQCTSSMVGGLGFEPRSTESESVVLPLDDPPANGDALSTEAPSRCQGDLDFDGEGGGGGLAAARMYTRTSPRPASYRFTPSHSPRSGFSMCIARTAVWLCSVRRGNFPGGDARPENLTASSPGWGGR